MLDIYVDGDACPVKEETYRVALRHGLKVFVVSHGAVRVPAKGRVEGVRVKPGFGAADDWIAEHSGEDDIVVTADIPLADRCLKKGSRVLATNGRVFTEASIGNALAQRALMDHLRQMGSITGGPPPCARTDRSRFLARLDDIVQRIKIPPGVQLPLHTHPVMNEGVLLDGELTVVTEDYRALHLQTGESIVEVVNKWHYGKNEGNKMAEILVFYVGVRDMPITITGVPNIDDLEKMK